jgi:sensor c-di-GMP phosphodiesterase-like protein
MLNCRSVGPALHFPSRTNLKIIAAAAGALVAGVSIVLFNGWLKKQGDDEVAIVAAWALSTSELQLGQTIAALQDLSARGVGSCRPAHIEAMRQTALLTGPIKQVMLIAPNGELMCADTSGVATRQEVLASAPAANSKVVLEVIRLPERGERFLRVRLASLAALVAPNLLLPQASTQGGRLPGIARIEMTDGTPIGDSGVAPNAAAQDTQSTAALRSQQYPFIVTVSMPRGRVVASYDDLRRIGIAMTGGIAMVILLFALLLAKREPDDPNADMAKAILNEEFVPYYQPLVDLQNGRLLGAEVLVRWRRSDGSVVEPNAFVLMLESSGLVIEFTRKLMRRVCQELGDAVGQRPAMTLAFNVAPRHFDDALILNDVGTIFDSSGIRLSQIVLELTERHEVVNLTAMRRTVAALQRVGCKVAIDDVGTGHSGLSYILKLGVDIIKIDKMFIDALGTDRYSNTIVETLIDLAQNMRMDVIAEGVESFEQVLHLRDLGIRAAQGFVFSPPLPCSAFLQLVETIDPLSAGEPSASEPAAAIAAFARNDAA